MKSAFSQVVCMECGHIEAADRDSGGLSHNVCAACGSGWLDARYDYGAVAPIWRTGLEGAQRERTLWRYAELLPVQPPASAAQFNEGGTPLIRLTQYEQLYEHPHIYVKDERRNPTGSFKDRQAALTVTALQRMGIQEVVLASTGNAAVAYAAYCARAGIKLWLFLTSLVLAEKMREAALYGAEIVKVTGTYDETKGVAAEFAKRRGIYLDRGARGIPGKESMKTLAFEIAEQLGLTFDGGGWRCPDWYIQAVSGGIGPLGVWKGFEELYTMGLIDRMPRLGIIQAAGCAPMVRAFAANKEKADPVIPKTLITVLATGDPGYSYTLLRQAALQTGGAMIAVEDGDTFAAMRKLASKAGFSVEPAAGVAFAGLEKMLSEGIIGPGETVVVNCSGHTFTAESHILGDRYALELRLDSQPEARREGLSAALRELDEQVTTILVVDDDPNARRLIRRLLRAYKQYRVLEARGGMDALEIVRDTPPDLIVCDLTMPGMDGFTLLDHLKNDPATAQIPVVVISAKTLNEQDRAFLEQYSESIWTKSAFDTRQLVDHIVRTLGDEPVSVIGASSTAVRTPVSAAGDLRRVLIIEDNPADSQLARRIMEAVGGLQITETASGRDGLKAIYEQRPDLVLLDLSLPDMDGLTILEIIQHNPDLKEIPIIIHSARALSSEERALYSDVIRGIIEKAAVDRSEFILRVTQALG
jgi:threonine synthase